MEAEPFLGAVRHLNLCRAVERDPAEGENACKAFLRGVRHIARDHGDSLAAAAEAAAAVYLALMSVLEVAAISGDFKAWAKEVPERTKHSKHLQAWLKDPEAGDKLYRAVAKWLKDDPEKNPGRRKRFGDLAATAASSSVSLSDSNEPSTDSSVSKHKKKQKKGKKRGKRAKVPCRAPSSSPSVGSSDTEPPKRKNKEKKAKKDQKKKTKPDKKTKKESKDDQLKRKARSSDDEAGSSNGDPKKQKTKAPPKEKAKKDDSKKALSISTEEPPSTPEEVQQEAVDYAAWGATDIRAFAAAVADVAVARGKPKGDPQRLTLSALISVLDNVPADALRAHGLAEALPALKTLTRLPREAKLDDILQRLDAIARAALPFALEPSNAAAAMAPLAAPGEEVPPRREGAAEGEP